MAASMASILEWPIERLDPLPYLHQEECPPNWLEKMNLHLIEHFGFYIVSVTLPEDWAPPGYHLLTGPSPRGDFLHTVVGYRGEIAHDPNPVGGGFREGERLADLIVFSNPAVLT